MTVNIALLGFGTVASGIPFLLKEMVKKSAQLPVRISVSQKF